MNGIIIVVREAE